MAWTKVEKEEGIFTEVGKEEGTFTKVEKEKVACTEVSKEKEISTKVSKVTGWLVEGWLINGWLLGLWEKVSKVISDWIGTDREKGTFVKVEKEEDVYTGVDKRDTGWLVNGWLIYGWLLDTFWGVVNKLTNEWNKVSKE